LGREFKLETEEPAQGLVNARTIWQESPWSQ